MTTAINQLSGRVKEFASACYDQNSIDELRTCLTDGADKSDLAEWDLTVEEWTDAVKAALSDRLESLEG